MIIYLSILQSENKEILKDGKIRINFSSLAVQAEHFPWEKYRVENSVNILPVGSMEQHGPHLPLNVDVIIPTSFAILGAERIKVLILPAIAYGYKSHLIGGGG